MLYYAELPPDWTVCGNNALLSLLLLALEAKQDLELILELRLERELKHEKQELFLSALDAS